MESWYCGSEHNNVRISQIFRAKDNDSLQKDNKEIRIIRHASSKTINKQGDGFTHTIWVFSRATNTGPTQQRYHSTFKTTACSAAHLDGQILSAYIILICPGWIGWPSVSGPDISGELSRWLTQDNPDPSSHWLPHTPLLAFWQQFLQGPPFCLWVCPHNGDGTHASSSITHTHSHTDTVLVWLCVKCSKSQSPRPASFVCPQLFRPGACIVLPGSLPEALWPETSSLIGPERDREELFLLWLLCSSLMFYVLLFWQLDC